MSDAKANGLPGVSIIIKGSNTGTSTDVNGKYSLAVPSAEAVLTYSYIGFDSQTKTVGNQSIIDVSLVENTAQLNEVIVRALGIKKEARTIG